MVMQPVFRSSSFSSRMSLYAYGTDTPSSSATSLTLIKISSAIGKIPSFPDLWLIDSPFYPQDSGRQPFSALCRFLFSLARSFHRLLPRRKYPLDGHSILRLLDFTPSLYNGHFFLYLLTILIVKFLWIKLICLTCSYCSIHISLSQAGLQENIK